MARILVVEDNDDIADVVVEYLRLAGHDPHVDRSGSDAERLIRGGAVDLCILDLMLPAASGLAILRAVRRTTSVPVIILSARASEGDRITGMELGADDYVVKPFSPRELVLRVDALLRRAAAGVEPAARDERRFVNGGGDLLRYRPGERRFFIGGSALPCTDTEFRLLEQLVLHDGQAMARDTLMERALGYHVESAERTIDTHVKNLRMKLRGAVATDAPWIETVRAFGYRFVGTPERET